MRSTRKKPCCARTLPWPRQVAQVVSSRCLVSEPVPSQTSHLTRVGTRSWTLVPAKASTRSISTCARRSDAGAGAAAAAAAGHVAEQALEDVAEAAFEVEAAGKAARAGTAALLERGMAEAVVSAALLVVLQHVVGLVDFLELGFGRSCRSDCGRGGTSSPACGRPSSGRPRWHPSAPQASCRNPVWSPRQPFPGADTAAPAF